MPERSWVLTTGESSIGVLSLIEIDQPWFRCSFTPGEGWGAVRQRFEAQSEAVDSGDEAKMMEAISAVRSMSLELRPLGEGELISPVIVQIRGNQANFRY